MIGQGGMAVDAGPPLLAAAQPHRDDVALAVPVAAAGLWADVKAMDCREKWTVFHGGTVGRASSTMARMTRRQLLRAAAAMAAGSALAGTPPTAGAGESPAEPTASHLPRWRGFNLFEMFHPEWSEGQFLETDFDWIAEWGFDFFRLPLSYWFWAKPEAMLEIDEDVLTKIDDAVRWGGERGMHVSLNMHRLPGYCVNPPEEPSSIFEDDATLAAAQHHWAMFAERYKGIPNGRLSFDLMNEPAGIDDPTYLRVHKALAEAIRAVDPTRLIVADGNHYGNRVVPGVRELGLAASTRGYQPMQISHYQAGWIGGSDTWDVPTWPLEIDGETRDLAWLRAHYEPWREAARNGLGRSRRRVGRPQPNAARGGAGVDGRLPEGLPRERLGLGIVELSGQFRDSRQRAGGRGVRGLPRPQARSADARTIAGGLAALRSAQSPACPLRACKAKRKGDGEERVMDEVPRTSPPVAAEPAASASQREATLDTREAELTRREEELNRREADLRTRAATLVTGEEGLDWHRGEVKHLRAEAARAALSSDAQLEALLSNAPVGFAFFDRSVRYLRINEPLAEINGISADAHLGRTVRDLLPGVADDVESLVERVFRTGRSVVGVEVEGETPREPGRRRWWLTSYYPVVEPGAVGGRPGVSAVGCVVLDISDRKRAEQMLREAKEHAIQSRISADRARETAERANKAKSEFLAVLSHELRTPLTPVLAGTQMYQRTLQRVRAGLEEVGEHHVQLFGETMDMVRRNVELEVRLIDDLLDLTRVTRGKLQLSRRLVDLNETARHVVEICQGDLHEHGLNLETDFSAGPLATLADPARLRQVLWNLVKNAVKFTLDGGTITLRTFSERQNGHEVVGCQVKDTGLGIDPDKLASIFNAFEQGGKGVTRTFGGLGLGLTISRHLVDAHGGRIFATSDGPGRGATFTVVLPARTTGNGGKRSGQPSAPRPEAQPAATTPSAPRQASAVEVGRILLVEDHADTAKLMGRFLTLQFKAEVVWADSVGAARRAYEQQGPFSLIISDIGLPDGTGIDLLAHLPADARPPAIALSGYGTDADIARSHAAGFAHHLTKPVDLDTLEDITRRALEQA